MSDFKGLEPVLFIPDTHAPYHNKRAWQLMLQVARDLKPVEIVVGGDFGEFYAVSRHCKDPNRERLLQREVKGVLSCLDDLDRLRAKRKKFIAGNHEVRLETYIKDKAPELFDMVTIKGILQLDDRNWDYTPYKSSTKVGKVHVTHDTGTAGQNAHLTAQNDFQDNVVINHTHRMAYAVKGNAQGSAHVAAMFGWLGDVKHIDYMHRVKANRDWALGFGVGYIDTRTGITYLTPVPIIKYTCVVNGKLYRG